jgi:hypothetical protein
VYPKGHRRRLVFALLLGLGSVSLVACSRIVGGTLPQTAIAACRQTMSSSGQDMSGWQVAVEIDHADASVVALTSGADIALCQTYRTSDGSAGFSSTDVGQSRYPAASPAVLTYITTQGKTPDQPSLLVGRVPPATTDVRLAFADGSTQAAQIGAGLWVAWLAVPATPTKIEALDAAGAVIGRLEDPNGIRPTQ